LKKNTKFIKRYYAEINRVQTATGNKDLSSDELKKIHLRIQRENLAIARKNDDK